MNVAPSKKTGLFIQGNILYPNFSPSIKLMKFPSPKLKIFIWKYNIELIKFLCTSTRDP